LLYNVLKEFSTGAQFHYYENVPLIEVGFVNTDDVGVILNRTCQYQSFQDVELGQIADGVVTITKNLLDRTD
jgi:hypothetical protein